MSNSDDSGVSPIRRDAVVASDLIATRELLKAETQAIHQLAQTAIAALDEKTDARIKALDEKVEALHSAQSERLEGLNKTLEAKLDALNTTGWDRIKDMEAASRERLEGLQEQLVVTEKLAVERLDSVRREILLMQKNAEVAIGKAEAATEKRFESVNEFREQLNDQTRAFATREMVEHAAIERRSQIAKIEDRVKEVEQWRSNSEGRQALRMILWPVVVGVVVFAATQVMRVMFPAPLAPVPTMYENPRLPPIQRPLP